jgi:hypothetical protein
VRAGGMPGPCSWRRLVTPPARHAASLPHELHDAREPPFGAALVHGLFAVVAAHSGVQGARQPGACAWPGGPGVARDLGLCCGLGVQAILQGMRWRLLAVAAGLVAYGMLVRPCVASRRRLAGEAGASLPGDGSAARVISYHARVITFRSSAEQAWPRLVQAGDGRAVAVAMATDGAVASRSPGRYPAGRPWRRGQTAGGRRLAACTRADPGGGAAR